MKFHRPLKIVSALLLFICVLSILINLAGLVINGIPKGPLILSYFGLLTLTLAVTFTASYRQIFKPNPKLIIASFSLVLFSQILGFALIQHALEDLLTAQFNEAMKDGIRQGLEDDTIPKGQGFEEQLVDDKFMLNGLFKSLAFYAALVILPLYVNLRNP